MPNGQSVLWLTSSTVSLMKRSKSPMLSSSHFPTSPLRVLALSPGIAVGPVRLFEATAGVVGQVSIAAEQVETEQQRLQNALANAISELDVLSERVAQVVGRSEADIFAAQQMMLEDPELVSEAYQLIVQQHLSASAAFQQVAELQARELASVGNEILAARAADIRDIAARVIRLLSAPSSGTPVLNEEPVILVANDLTPSDTATLNPETILGICTVVGGPT